LDKRVSFDSFNINWIVSSSTLFKLLVYQYLGNDIDNCSVASATTTTSSTNSSSGAGPGTNNSYCSWFANLGIFNLFTARQAYEYYLKVLLIDDIVGQKYKSIF
jgi:hypothetical protein